MTTELSSSESTTPLPISIVGTTPFPLSLPTDPVALERLFQEVMEAARTATSLPPLFPLSLPDVTQSTHIQLHQPETIESRLGVSLKPSPTSTVVRKTVNLLKRKHSEEPSTTSTTTAPLLPAPIRIAESKPTRNRPYHLTGLCYNGLIYNLGGISLKSSTFQIVGIHQQRLYADLSEKAQVDYFRPLDWQTAASDLLKKDADRKLDVPIGSVLREYVDWLKAGQKEPRPVIVSSMLSVDQRNQLLDAAYWCKLVQLHRIIPNITTAVADQVLQYYQDVGWIVHWTHSYRASLKRDISVFDDGRKNKRRRVLLNSGRPPKPIAKVGIRS